MHFLKLTFFDREYTFFETALRQAKNAGFGIVFAAGRMV